MSIATQISRLQSAKADIKTAIENKGVTVPSGTLLDGYAELIDDITGGGTSEIVDNPTYFHAECIDTLQKINNLRNSHTFVMYFITDSHVYTSSNNMQYLDAQLASLNAIAKTIKPDLVVHGGDMTNGSEEKSITIGYTDHIVACMREIGGNNTHILIGNHDGNTVQPSSSGRSNETERITEAEMLTMYRSWNDGFTYAGSNYEGGNFYGYKDYSEIGLRVIRLHSYIEKIGVDGYYGGQGQNWGYYDDELTWFRNVALNTDNTILIICHQTLSPVLQGYAENSGIPHNGTLMQQALDNWLNANSSHRCAGLIHGHVHWDYSAKGKGTFTVIDHSTKEEMSRTGTYGEYYEHGMGYCNYLTSFPTSNAVPVSSYRDVPVDAIVYGRQANNATQGLWTAVIVDTQAETINLVRFGAGNDRAYNYGAGTYYSISNNLTAASSNNSATLIEAGNPYTATITADTGYTISSYSVTMGGTDITSTAYSNGVITIPAVTGNVVITVAATKPQVNVLPNALDTDLTSIYPTVSHPDLSTVGYAEGYRLSSSGTESASSSNQVTGFIPAVKGQTMTLENIELPATNYTGYNTCYIAVYDSTKTCIKSNYSKDWFNTSANAPVADSNNHITSITFNEGVGHQDLSEMAYVRISTLQMSESSKIYIE